MMTKNREMVLGSLFAAGGPLTANDLSAAAPSRVRLKSEWAYPSLRWGVAQGYIKTVGATKGFTEYQITQAGRLQLGAI